MCKHETSLGLTMDDIAKLNENAYVKFKWKVSFYFPSCIHKYTSYLENILCQ